MPLLIKMLFAMLFSLLINSSTVAIEVSNLESAEVEHEIYLDPWLAYQKIQRLPVNEEDRSQYLWWLLRKAQCEYYLYLYDDFEQTINSAVRLINTETSLAIQSRLNLFRGIMHRNKAEYIKSSQFLNLALQQAKEADLSRIYINAKQEHAYTQSLAELFETSLTDMQEAYVKAFALNDQFLIAVINETYGAIYMYMHDYAKSIEYYLKALESYEKLNYKAHIAESIYGLASTYRYWGKYDLAIDYFKLFQDKVIYTPNKEMIYLALYGLGMTLAEQGECVKSIAIIEQALMMKGIKDYDAELLKNKALCLIKLKDIAQAETALAQAAALFEELPDLQGTSWHLELMKIESRIAYAKKQYDLSYRLLDEYYQKYTNVLRENSSERLLSVRTDMEKERQEVEKALSMQRTKVASLEQKAQQQKNITQQYIMTFMLVIILIIFAVIFAQRRANQRMLEQSITDPLSGLYNRRYMFKYLDKTLSGMVAGRSQLSILLLDIDDFKGINDRYGHPAGDYIIQKFAEIGEEVLRSGDLMGRIGGEEFLCILPRTPQDKAYEVAQRMLTTIAEYKFSFATAGNIKVTTSIGVASFSEQADNCNILYSEADKALYQAKRNGKNCIEIAFAESDEYNEST